uniref:Uncharacterized protein n=1 Tax=Chelativorans sp. (strain BNC1) TaxID=266779 RepID=Q11J34_CHESB
MISMRSPVQAFAQLTKQGASGIFGHRPSADNPAFASIIADDLNFIKRDQAHMVAAEFYANGSAERRLNRLRFGNLRRFGLHSHGAHSS